MTTSVLIADLNEAILNVADRLSQNLHDAQQVDNGPSREQLVQVIRVFAEDLQALCAKVGVLGEASESREAAERLFEFISGHDRDATGGEVR